MQNSSRILVASVLAVALLACGGEGGEDGGDGSSGPAPANIVDPEPGATNTVIRLFSRPFANEFEILNYFDHDVPTAPSVTNRYQLTWRGDHAVPGKDVRGYDGHKGIDWLLPQNTPLFAVTDSEVTLAGEVTEPCFLEDNKLLTALIVRLRFVAPDGNTYVVGYGHLNRVDVAVADTVAEGQQIGLSGVTGCVGKAHIPHVHFSVERLISLSPRVIHVIDPYGWEGPGVDPWSANDSARRSIWLWKQGQAPDMVPWRN